jgi:hypothetical protein
MANSGVAKKHRKHSRSKLYCEFYKRTNRREKNKVRVIVKHLRRFQTTVAQKPLSSVFLISLRFLLFEGKVRRFIDAFWLGLPLNS